jgi:hypothetical protein
MSTTALPKPPAQYIIDEIIVPNWDKTAVRGYDPQDSASADAYLPLATSIDDVGQVFPSLIISDSQPGPSGGETSYDFLTSQGPGQNRVGTVVATARAEDLSKDKEQYAGDTGTYSTVDADQIIYELITHVEDICINNANAAGTELSWIGANRPSNVPDDTDPTPPVMQDQAVLPFGTVRKPT